MEDSDKEKIQTLLISDAVEFINQAMSLLGTLAKSSEDVLEIFDIPQLEPGQIPKLPKGVTFLMFVGIIAKFEPDWCNGFSELHITEPTPHLSESIQYLRNLEVVKIYRCQLETLPDEIGELSKLRVLNLGYNHILSLPKTFSNLQNLESLSLAGNPITIEGIPIELGSLPKLQKFYVWFSGLVDKDQLEQRLNNPNIVFFGY